VEASPTLRNAMTFDEFKREVNAIKAHTGAILGVGETIGGFFLTEPNPALSYELNGFVGSAMIGIRLERDGESLRVRSFRASNHLKSRSSRW
jgi:hypothetical protein